MFNCLLHYFLKKIESNFRFVFKFECWIWCQVCLASPKPAHNKCLLYLFLHLNLLCYSAASWQLKCDCGRWVGVSASSFSQLPTPQTVARHGKARRVCKSIRFSLSLWFRVHFVLCFLRFVVVVVVGIIKPGIV